ncbi:hypothetical protein QCM77_04820 [Bradyrhizobium sp. SSUT18]|uniref:hypothetical protein n=1 Tax=Bradyrhizobium sp. SSUT18 TaxID=3040602 RepID=UPI0024479480|nr:hypothetical protein [Bradyrhizobium sp. SSUT18]MDH2399271.1 hypothetical protein [Bradyrhizobium sp. SSUT18]
MRRFAEQNDFRGRKPLEIRSEIVAFGCREVLTGPMQELDQFALGLLANALGCW